MQFGISDTHFWSLTPAQLDAMIEAHRDHHKNTIGLLQVAILAGQTRKHGGACYTLDDLYPETTGGQSLSLEREQSVEEMLAAWDLAISTRKKIHGK